MKLLIDIGNTTIKFALTNKHKIEKKITLVSDVVISVEKVIKQLQNNDIPINKIDLIGLSSVKPDWDSTIKSLANNLHVPLYQVKHNLNVNDLKININNPQILGADLLIGAYGGFKKYPNQDLIIISFGTATTISTIVNKQFEGTIIMPGLKISAEILFDKAALLTSFSYQLSDKIIGKNTEEAINIGVVNGHLLGVKCLVNNIKKHLNNPKILITGGNNYNYEQFFDNFELEPNLIFEGLEFSLENL